MKKKAAFLIYLFVLLGISLIVTTGCKNKDNNPVPATVKDIDGNVYHMVTVCTQVWMVENLKTTRFNDGQAIPLVTDSAAWSTLTTPGYCWYQNDAGTYKNNYGALYNWTAVNTGKLAPAGWHIPTISVPLLISGAQAGTLQTKAGTCF